MEESIEYNYPCVECDGELLAVIPGYPTIVECAKCGHPQDLPPIEYKIIL